MKTHRGQILRLGRIFGGVVSITPHWIELACESTEHEGLLVRFSPYQAVRFTTIDCFAGTRGFSGTCNGIQEIRGSEWIKQLRSTLKTVDEDADFLNRSKHYALATGDAVVEIVSAPFTVSAVSRERARKKIDE